MLRNARIQNGREEIVPSDGDKPPSPGNTQEEDVEKPGVMRSPTQLTKAGVYEHEATHTHPRDLRPDCVSGRVTSDQNRKPTPHIQDAAAHAKGAIPTLCSD